MKKIFFLLFIIVITVASCNIYDEPNNKFELLPVESVVMPDSYKVDSTSQITVKYRRPSTCHIFNGFYYDINEFTRTVAVESIKLDQNNCTDANILSEIPLDFHPQKEGIYTFKFFTGTNATSGEDEFLNYEVEVLP
ncbi:MAG: hypothetical protein V4548_06290 [Bacteroidota bacterium]